MPVDLDDVRIALQLHAMHLVEDFLSKHQNDGILDDRAKCLEMFVALQQENLPAMVERVKAKGNKWGLEGLTDADRHRYRHIRLHRALDELVADYLNQNRMKLLSETTVLDLIEWSGKQQREAGPDVA